MRQAVLIAKQVPGVPVRRKLVTVVPSPRLMGVIHPEMMADLPFSAFKAGTMGLWLAVGAHWHALLDPYALWLALLGLVCLTYVAVIWWRQ